MSGVLLKLSTAMRGKAVACLLAISLVIGAGLGYLAGANMQGTTTRVLTTTQLRTMTACGTPSGVTVPVLSASSANSSRPGVLALVLSPGSNATVLIDYCGYGHNFGSLALKPLVLVCTVYGCRGPSSNVTITAVPNIIVLDDSAEWVVAYHISANTNSKGHYLLDFPYADCPAPLLAVGFAPSDLKISDFPGWVIAPGCFSVGEILTVEGEGTTYVGY